MATSFSATLNTVVMSALRKALRNTPVEQNYTHVAILAALEKDRETATASQSWQVPISNAGTALGGPFEGAQQTSTSGVDDVTGSIATRAQYAEPVVVLKTDEWDTTGDEATVLYKAAARKLTAAKLRLRAKLDTDIASTSAVTGGIQGIPLAIEESPSSSGAYQGVSGNSVTYWRNQTRSTVAFSTAGMTNLEGMSDDITSVTQEGAPFDYLLVSKNVNGFIKTAARTFLTLNAPATGASADRARTAEMGWTNLSFGGKPIMFSARLSDGYVYFMRNASIKLVVDPRVEFTMSDFVDLGAVGQHGRIAHLYWRGQLVTFERATLGQINAVTA